MSMIPFVRNFLGIKGGQAAEGVVKAIVNLDPDAATQADLRVMAEDLDKAGKAIAQLRGELAQEQRELDAIGRQYNELMAAAELIQKKIDDPATQAPQKEGLQKSLAGLVDRMEHMVPEIDRDKKEVADTQSLVAEAEAAYREKADALGNAKAALEHSKHDLERARLEEERARQKAEQAEVLAGLKRSPTSSLTVALDAMQKTAAQARERAEASTMKATALGHAKDAASDQNVAEALAQVRGTDTNNRSLSERLAALKRS
jgi:septal ring factor EnvC (AmiA/AmiB activator)